MKSVFAQKGKIVIKDLPIPYCNANSVLVEVSYSLISSGTEMRAVKGSNFDFKQAFLKKKTLVNKITEQIIKDGLSYTLNYIDNKMNKLVPLGYSVVGKVIQAGNNVNDISVGEIVCCGGTGFANHAEFVSVPRNLVVKVPDKIDLTEAVFSVVGAVSLHSIHQSEPILGEKAVVIGLGLIGILTMKLLKCFGVDTLGIDIDPSRVDIVNNMGLKAYTVSEAEDKTDYFTNKIGADLIFVCASSNDSAVLQLASKICRNRGKVIVVGFVNLNLDWGIFYSKEIKLLMSRSYGPGRYDPKYEIDNIDYPIEYVRFTENRNIELFLDLLKNHELNVKPLISKIFNIDEAALAYQSLENKDCLGVVLKYGEPKKKNRVIQLSNKKPEKNSINVAVTGPGNFATEKHFPNLYNDKFFNIKTVVASTGISAHNAAKLLDAQTISTDYSIVLKDKEIDLVFISTPPQMHGKMVLDALKAGKKVFVEKPLCTTENELKEIESYILKNKSFLMVGHNRRFAPFSEKVKQWLKINDGPTYINYTVIISPVQDRNNLSGGKIIEEMTHFLDLFNFFIDSNIVKINSQSLGNLGVHSINNNITVNILFEDGSIANLTYLTIASTQLPKETISIHKNETSAIIEDFEKLTLLDKNSKKEFNLKVQDKGWKEELNTLSEALKGNKDISFELSSSILATKTAFEIIKQIRK